MLTEDEARRVAVILKETIGLPIAQRLDRIEKEIPRAPTIANIIMALHTLIDLDALELSELEPRYAAHKKALSALERTNALAGGADMTVAEAEDYLKGLAQAGNQEAQELLAAFNDPFLEP